jgi:hypothetical protein
MPQFDTFSFFSQLFWVFLCFFLLYSVLCFYLLPALAATLKIRKRKLAQTSGASNATDLIVDNNFYLTSKTLLEDYNSKLVKLSSSTSESGEGAIFANYNSLFTFVSAFGLSFKASLTSNASIYSQSKITTLLYS